MEINDVVASFNGMAKGLDASFSYFWPPTGNQDPVELNMTVNFSYILRDMYGHRNSNFYFEVSIAEEGREKYDGVFIVDNSVLIVESKRVHNSKENLNAITDDLKRLAPYNKLLGSIGSSAHWVKKDSKMPEMPFYSIMLFQTYTRNEETHNLVKMWEEGPPDEKSTPRDHQMDVRRKINELWKKDLTFAAYKCEKLEKAWGEGSDWWCLYFLLAVKKHK